jgi:hypothetical protein
LTLDSSKKDKAGTFVKENNYLFFRLNDYIRTFLGENNKLRKIICRQN